MQEQLSPEMAKLLGITDDPERQAKEQAIIQKLKETQDMHTNLHDLQHNGELEAILVSIPVPYQVRCREGGGPENKTASLAISVAKMTSALYSALLQPMETADKDKRLLVVCTDQYGNKLIYDAHYSDGAPCPDATYPQHEPSWYYAHGGIDYPLPGKPLGWFPRPPLELPKREELTATEVPIDFGTGWEVVCPDGNVIRDKGRPFAQFSDAVLTKEQLISTCRQAGYWLGKDKQKIPVSKLARLITIRQA